VPIVGPRGELGALVVWRAGSHRSTRPRGGCCRRRRRSWARRSTRACRSRASGPSPLELQRLDELRSNLLATVAHELLSPLTAVKGVLGLLSMQEDLGARVAASSWTSRPSARTGSSR
jgi:signal transduction histidine kinase